MFKTYIATSNGVLKVQANITVQGNPLNGGTFSVADVKIMTLAGEEIFPIGILGAFVAQELLAGAEMAYDVSRQMA